MTLMLMADENNVSTQALTTKTTSHQKQKGSWRAAEEIALITKPKVAV